MNHTCRSQNLAGEAQISLAPFNGHAYEVITSPTLAWQAAATYASNRVFRGVNGHLATITSQAEQGFIWSSYNKTSYFVDGTDTGHEGIWMFTTGPEAGKIYSTGSASVNGSYVDWRQGEPNNGAGRVQNCMHLYWFYLGQWDDVQCDESHAFIVEYECVAGSYFANSTCLPCLLQFSCTLCEFWVSIMLV